jgi:hypothetical protein
MGKWSMHPDIESALNEVARHTRRPMTELDVEGSGAGSQAKLGGVGFGRGSSPRHRQERDRAGHGNAGRKDHLPAG